MFINLDLVIMCKKKTSK